MTVAMLDHDEYKDETDDNSSTVVAAPNAVPDCCNGMESLNLEERAHLSSLLAPGHEVVSVEKNVVVRSVEVFMVNGTPISLHGEDGEKIKECLLSGTIPNQDLINHLLMKAGLFLKPVKQVMRAEITVSSVDKRCERSTVAARKNDSSSPAKVLSQGMTVTEQASTINDTKCVVIGGDIETEKSNAKTTTTKPAAAALRRSDLHHRPAISCSEPSKDFFYHLDHFVVDGGKGGVGQSEEEDHQYSLLLWSRLFATPANILAHFSSRAESAVAAADRRRSQHTFDALSRWITWFPEDFGDEATMQKLRRIFQLFASSASVITAKSMHLLSTLSAHLAAIKKHEHFLSTCTGSSKKETTSCLNLSAMEAAQELTRIELEYLTYLGPAEFINMFAREGSATAASNETSQQIADARVRSAQKTRNFDAYIKWFNHVSFLVASSVCKTKKKKERANVIEFWLEVARMSVNIGNFNSLMGIITGLNMFPVARLHKTWTRVQSGKFSVLEHQMDPSSNFLSYRSTLTAAVARSENATDDRQRIIIPFFSLFVKDLYTAKEEVKLGGSHFDPGSMEAISRTIRDFSKWKEVNCPFEKSQEFSQYLLQQCVLDEDDLDLESFNCEVPRTQTERDRYRYLKDRIKTASNS